MKISPLSTLHLSILSFVARSNQKFLSKTRKISSFPFRTSLAISCQIYIQEDNFAFLILHVVTKDPVLSLGHS